MNATSSFFFSSIGRKWIVAITGLVLFGFVVGHMVGNLQIFLGPEAINRYGAFLQGLGELLWIIRIGLLVMFVLHIVATVQLRIENRAARPVGYAVTKRRRASLPALWMVWSGLTVLCFVVFHLLHFTTHNIDTSFATLHDAQGRHDIYRMMVLGFTNKAASAFYIVGIGLLAMHLHHGFQSLFQTFGLSSAKIAPLWDKGGQVLSWLIFLGYVSIPIAVLSGAVK
ncbi:MAG: succinate dehydrogenase / fumarate reductase, cytochrome b subunit [Chthoniobacter sp.]|nr:succinate dehydrogenase / fumarate reductase, cytochrome b subunit [Chthoniobacter sp.]